MDGGWNDDDGDDDEETNERMKGEGGRASGMGEERMEKGRKKVKSCLFDCKYSECYHHNLMRNVTTQR
jgi:hypothetical protein